MAEKRTKSDKAQRQADKLGKKRPARKSMPETRQSKIARIENFPSQGRRERNEREDFSQAAARIVKEATENH